MVLLFMILHYVKEKAKNVPKKLSLNARKQLPNDLTSPAAVCNFSQNVANVF